MQELEEEYKKIAASQQKIEKAFEVVGKGRLPDPVEIEQSVIEEEQQAIEQSPGINRKSPSSLDKKEINQ